jgi:hypothetical protein
MSLNVVSDVLGHSTIKQEAANTYRDGDEAVTADWVQRLDGALAAATRTPANEAAEGLTPR